MTIQVTPDKKTTLEGIFPVSISETDCSGMVKPVVILNYMQDLAAKSIDNYDPAYSCEELLKKGLGWFLIRYRVECDTPTYNVKELQIKTECRGAQKMTTYRDFEVFDNNTKNRILRATSSWFIVNLVKKSVLNIQKEFPEFLMFDSREDDISLNKLKPLSEFDCQKTFGVRYDDLDINNHVNNTVYISWALEALDYDFRRSHWLKTMDIYYKHEAKYNDEVISLVKYDKQNSVTEHLIKNAQTNEDLCLLRFTWQVG